MGTVSPGLKRPGRKVDRHLRLVPTLRIHGVIIPLPIRLHGVIISEVQCTSMEWYLVKHRDNFIDLFMSTGTRLQVTCVFVFLAYRKKFI
jgi:hypothetical protein